MFTRIFLAKLDLMFKLIIQNRLQLTFDQKESDIIF